MKKHLFLVDNDEADVARFLSEIEHVKLMPFKCTWAKNGAQALNQLNYLSPDIIFVDARLPDMNGMECLAAIRRTNHLREVPVVLHSSAVTDEEKEKAIRLGASAWLDRPHTLLKLVSILNMLIPSPSEEE